MIKSIKPESEEHWLKLRTEDVTSTEVSALFGLSPYLTEFELWHRKKEKNIVKIDENDRMKWGKRLEPVIAEGIAADHGWSIQIMKSYVRDEDLKMGSSFDYFIGDDGILEIKNVDNLVYKSGWSIDGDDVEAPHHIELQVQHQLALTGRKYALIGALIGGNQVTLIRREPDAEIMQSIKERIFRFWQSIEKNTPPKPNFEKDHDFIKKLYAYSEPGKVIEANDRIIDLAQKYYKFSEQIKVAETQKDGIKAELLTLIGDSEKVKAETFSISAGIIGESQISYTRKPYRDFRINFKKEKK